ncbi:MAG: PucR family transcriptional regulator ligand-binding domain-containing protein [Synergistaceae bacterium]|jgi:purine catabolism regulator|nr:PucR family transcriptional regulator ligand-binding domain-containing protein [Synergistaceae bacterium]
MPLAVEQILKLPELPGITLIAGSSGLAKSVRGINVMEAPEIIHWLQCGDFLLSSCYQFRDSVKGFEDFVRAIHKAGVAALGFKNRFIQEIPQVAKDFADRIGLPILGIPIEIPYSDVIRVVILKTDGVENVRLSETVIRAFSEALRDGGGAPELLQRLESFLCCGVCFVSDTMKKCFCSSGKQFADECMAADEGALLKKYPHEHVVLSQFIHGYFVFESPLQDNDMGRVILEHAKTAMHLALQKEIVVMEIEARYHNDFVRDLLIGNIRHQEEIINRSSAFGWDLTRKLRVVIFDIDNYKKNSSGRSAQDGHAAVRAKAMKEQIYSICKNEMSFFFQNLPCLTMKELIVFIVNTESCHNFNEKLSMCCGDIQEKARICTGHTLSVGVGNEKDDFGGLSESYDEARRAIEVMRHSKGDGGFHVWDEMGVLTVLAPVAGSSEARKFFATRLGKLLEDENLLYTLQMLVNQDWNFKAAARDLKIHYNTIHYRYERICELTGMDLSVWEKRLEVTVALKLLSLNPNWHHEPA